MKYAGDEPPPGYSIEAEVEALGRFADSLGLERFHLLAYSGGGFISLAFAGTHPERLLSLAVFEPAGVPGEPTAEEADLRRKLNEALAGLTGGDFIRTFMEAQVKPGVELGASCRAAAALDAQPAGGAGGDDVSLRRL